MNPNTEPRWALAEPCELESRYGPASGAPQSAPEPVIHYAASWGPQPCPTCDGSVLPSTLTCAWCQAHAARRGDAGEFGTSTPEHIVGTSLEGRDTEGAYMRSAHIQGGAHRGLREAVACQFEGTHLAFEGRVGYLDGTTLLNPRFRGDGGTAPGGHRRFEQTDEWLHVTIFGAHCTRGRFPHRIAAAVIGAVQGIFDQCSFDGTTLEGRISGDFPGSTFLGADLSRANIRGMEAPVARGVCPQSMIYDDETIFPESYIPDENWMHMDDFIQAVESAERSTAGRVDAEAAWQLDRAYWTLHGLDGVGESRSAQYQA